MVYSLVWAGVVDLLAPVTIAYWTASAVCVYILVHAFPPPLTRESVEFCLGGEVSSERSYMYSFNQLGSELNWDYCSLSAICLGINVVEYSIHYVELCRLGYNLL